MKTLSLIRHAKSTWKHLDLDDRDRPLSSRGALEAEILAESRGGNIFTPDLILVSPSSRTQETAKILKKKKVFVKKRLQSEERLYGADLDTLLALVSHLDDRLGHVALVGHNPGLSELAAHLSDRYQETLPTGSLTTLQFRHDSWRDIGEGDGSLIDYFVPEVFSTKTDKKIKGGGVCEAKAAMFRILQAMFDRITGLEASIRVDEDREALHDFRVAIRRIRTVLRFVPSLCPDEIQKYFGEEFRWLMGETSSLRDLDTHLEDVCVLRSSLEEPLGVFLDSYEIFLREKRSGLRGELHCVLDSPRYRKLFGDFTEFLAAKAPQGPEVLKDFSAPETTQSLRRLRKRLLRQGGDLTGQSSAPEFHRFRKTTKKLRYLLELRQELVPHKTQGRLIRRLKRLQDVLGMLQDVETQQQTLLDYCQSDSARPETCLALGRIFGLLSQRRDAALKEFDEVYDDFAHRLQSGRVKKLWLKEKQDMIAGNIGSE
ncbi:MAG: CHAD domain-containing protein [Desulfuromonadales bacterium]